MQSIASRNHIYSSSDGHRRLSYWLYFFITLHFICWSLAPALIRHNLPLDAVEGSLWGHQLEWGYDKNPFLNGWLTALAIYLGGSSGWMVYCFSQLSVIICFFAVWQIAKQILSPVHALLSVMILEGVQYFNFHAIDFNDNTLELSLWALCSYFFYQALRKQHRNTLEWICTGFFAGLGMMAKYYTAALLAAMFLFVLMRRESRQQLLTAAPYFGLLIFFVVITPHVLWLYAHQFITISYVFERASSEPLWSNHLFYPTQFIWQQFEAFIPAIILCLPLLYGKARRDTLKYRISHFDKTFLFYIGFGPLLLTALLSVLFGIKLRGGWGMPLLSLWGIALIAILQPHLSQKKLKFFIVYVLVLMGALLSGYGKSLIYSNTGTSANFPGKEMAQAVTAFWHKQYQQNLAFIAGSRWLGGNIALYSNDHPAVFMEWDEEHSPWIKLNELEQKGAIFIWDISAGEELPDDVKHNFPRLMPPVEMEFNFHRNEVAQLTPVKIGIAVLPPRTE